MHSRGGRGRGAANIAGGLLQLLLGALTAVAIGITFIGNAPGLALGATGIIFSATGFTLDGTKYTTLKALQAAFAKEEKEAIEPESSKMGMLCMMKSDIGVILR